MLISTLLLLLSLVLLYFGASWLVKASVMLALRAGITPLIAGLTFVTLGTSSPVLVVGINAAISGHGNIVIGNVLGSNLFNILVILGVSAIISPLKIKMQILKIDILILIISTLLFIIFFADRQISRMEGVVLFTGLIIYTFVRIRLAKREKSQEVSQQFSESIRNGEMKWYLATGLAIFGVALLVAGSELLIKGAVDIALKLGIGETIIGMTIIATGISIPVLASSVVATMKKQYDIAIGNILVSCIFNILFITGISSMAQPVSDIAISNIDLYVILGATLLLLPFVRTNYNLKRDEGIFMIGMYLIYMYYLWPK